METFHHRRQNYAIGIGRRNILRKTFKPSPETSKKNYSSNLNFFHWKLTQKHTVVL